MSEADYNVVQNVSVACAPYPAMLSPGRSGTGAGTERRWRRRRTGGGADIRRQFTASDVITD